MNQTNSFDGERKKRAGAVVFTGPDGLSDYRTTLLEPGYIGHTERSPDATGKVDYLWRPCKVRNRAMFITHT